MVVHLRRIDSALAMTTPLRPHKFRATDFALLLLSFASIAWLVILVWKHPVAEGMAETRVLEGVRRAMGGQPVYAQGLEHNALYYYLCSFAARFLGLTIGTLRQISVVA